jgi:MFS family permease
VSFLTYGVGYVARPIGAFVLGHWGDTHGRKNVLVLCMLLMGGSTFLVALLPTYDSVGILAPILLVVPAPDPGLRGRAGRSPARAR